MKKLKRFLAIIASVLAVSLFVSSEAGQIIASAVGEDLVDSKLYMSEVKMFYGQTEAEAKTACEKEGFIFCPTNLNEGGVVVEKDIWTMDNNRNVFVNAKIGIYMGYKTTEDPGEAITDLTLLDMKNTHFEEMNYQEFLDKHIEEFRDQAAQMMLLVNELDRKMKAGSPNAMMAYDSLNLMYVDESKPHDAEDNQLGYYLINKADITFFEKFIQRGSTKMLSKITDLLCNATSDYNEDGTTWVDRAKVSEVAYEYTNATSETKNMYDQNCEDTAKKLVKALRDLKKTYSEAKTRWDTYGETLGYSELEGMTKENGVEKLSGAELDCRFPEYVTALRTYALLDAFPYQKKGETVVNNAALLIEAASDEQTDEQTSEQTSEQTDEQTSEQASEQTQQIEEMTETYTKDMSLAEYLMELASDNTLEDHLYTLYPIVMSLSQAQRVALSLGGFNKLVEGLYQSNDYLSKRSEAVKEATQKLRDNGCADGRLYLWTGMDTSLYNKKVVQTDALKEAAASGIDLQNSINEAARKEQDTLNQTLIIIDICTLGYGGIMMLTNAILGSTLWAIGANFIASAGVNLAAGVIGSAIGGYLLGGLLCAMWALNILSIVVGLVMLIYSILKWTGFFDQPDAIDYTNIPDVAMDARQAAKGTYQVRYDAVHSNAKSVWNSFFSDRKSKPVDEFKERISEEYAEMSSYMAIYDRWIVMYYSKSPDAGKPIEVKPGQEPFVTSGNYKVPEGYRPLTLVTGNTAVDVNDVDIFEKKGTPLYVFFPGKASGTGAGGVVSDSGTYVTKVRLSYSEKREDAINLLKKDKYDYFDVNLTPYSGYTFLGYQLGSAANALTDIRLSNSGSDAIVFGDASYGKMGQDGKGTTPDGLSLFATASKSAGSPIVSISIENKRLGLGSGREPVCLFSGGDAVDIGTKWKDNILECGEDDNVEFFLKKGGWTTYANSRKSYSYEFLRQDDPDNGLYLYFQPKEQFKSKDENGNAAQRYIAGFSYFLAGDKETDKDNNKFGSNYEYMQKFAKSNGFELLQQDGEPFRVMSDEAGEMTMGTTWTDVGGYPVDTYHFDQFHTVQYNTVVAGGDGGLSHGFINYTAQYIHDYLIRENEKMIFHTAMYFGVAYTYNPYRAITGITGLITPYTEKNNQIKNTGMKTPAGTFQACNVSMQGSPMMSAGITAGYYNAYTMSFPFYTNYEAKQKSNLDWMTHDETEIMSHYLMTSGPRDGVSPLKEEDITFSMSEKPGEMKEYVPLCDLRTPGDYEHPLNLALDTTNKGSKYLYLFLKKNAGGRVADMEEKLNSSGEIIQEGKNVLLTNEYTQKKYVAAVFCGVGDTPEAAIADLYSNASRIWATVASEHEDISARPMATEFDEIIPVDLSSEHPWYELHCNDTSVKSLKNGVWVRGNELAYYRWDGHDREEKKTINEYEKDWKCAYVGVVRTSNDVEAAYGLLKYYTNSDTAPETLKAGETDCYRAGGPVNSSEGKYFLYYSTNSGTAAYSAPITKLHISKDIFINGYNTSFSVSESDRKDNKLPQFGQLRMRTDEYQYIHLGYDREALPYYERLYIGVGDTKAEAFVDMVGTTNAYAAIDVNCNYNSFSKKWIALGYRRTNVITNAITDIFLYSGDDPPDQVRISGGYMGKETVSKGKKVLKFVDFSDTNGAGVQYKLVKHNLKSGAEVVSLNEGNGGTGLYLYYTTANFYLDKSAESAVTPITNISFSYGDISPRYASTEQLAAAFEKSYFGTKEFDISAYQDPIWECVVGVEGSPENWKLTADGAARYSLNKGVIPGRDGNGWNASDNRVYMYVDRKDSNAITAYQIRESCKLPDFGYYSPTSTFGYLKQVS